MQKKTSASGKRFLLVGSFFALVLCCTAIFGVSLLNQGATGDGVPDQPGDIKGYLRGGRILVLRLPKTDPVQQIEVFDDATAAHVAFSSDLSIVYKKVSFPNNDWFAVDQLRKQWCQSLPQFRPLGTDEPYYDVGLRCNGAFDLRQLRIPTNQLPPELATLLVRLPNPTE